MASVDEIEAMLQKDMGQTISIQPTTATSPAETGYSWKQLAFDVPVGVAKAGAGLADILSYPVIKGAQLAGVSPETLPTFGMTKLIETGMQPVAQEYGVRPTTEAQKFIEFVAPSPVSKGKLLGEAVTGGLGYVGSKVGEIVAPESPLTQLALTLGLPIGAKVATAKTITETGKALQRESFQPRKADLTAARNALVEMPEGDSQTQLTKSLNNIIEGNILGKSRNPKKLESNLNAANSEIENQIQASLKSAEQKIGPVPPPSFDNAQQYVLQGSVPANQMDNYFAEIANLQSSIAKEGKGSLVFLNRQRKSIGESWKNENASDAGFWRAMYQDIKQHIEKYAPEVQDLNKQKQDLVVVRPVIEQASKASEKGLTLKDAIRYFGYTTGGGAVPTLALATGNYPLAALISAGLGLAATPRGQQITGKALQNLGQTPASTLALSLAGKTVPGIAENNLTQTVPETVQKQVLPLTSEQRQKLLELRSQALSNTPPITEPTKEPQSIKVGKQNVSIPVGEQYAPPALVKAVMQVESAGKPKAVSPKGAAGLMQLMPATAKDLDVEDRFDPTQNVEGGSRYLQQQLAKYGKTDIALAAYNWGPRNIDNAIKKVKAEGKRVTWANIMQVVKVPMETRLYVNKVLKNKEVEA
jgi:soluble lytic murein transglycosylase-like protein